MLHPQSGYMASCQSGNQSVNHTDGDAQYVSLKKRIACMVMLLISNQAFLVIGHRHSQRPLGATGQLPPQDAFLGFYFLVCPKWKFSRCSLSKNSFPTLGFRPRISALWVPLRQISGCPYVIGSRIWNNLLTDVTSADSLSNSTSNWKAITFQNHSAVYGH